MCSCICFVYTYTCMCACVKQLYTTEQISSYLATSYLPYIWSQSQYQTTKTLNYPVCDVHHQPVQPAAEHTRSRSLNGHLLFLLQRRTSPTIVLFVRIIFVMDSQKKVIIHPVYFKKKGILGYWDYHWAKWGIVYSNIICTYYKRSWCVYIQE